MISYVITAASLITALGILIGLVCRIYKWYLKQERQNEEIKKIKEEDTLVCFALSACLDGLIQLGANHTVPIAKEKLDKHLNKTAHKQ